MVMGKITRQLSLTPFRKRMLVIQNTGLMV